jgi:hypothetical protein
MDLEAPPDGDPSLLPRRLEALQPTSLEKVASRGSRSLEKEPRIACDPMMTNSSRPVTRAADRINC